MTERPTDQALFQQASEPGCAQCGTTAHAVAACLCECHAPFLAGFTATMNARRAEEWKCALYAATINGRRVLVSIPE